MLNRDPGAASVADITSDINTHKVHVTFFKNIFAKTLTTAELSLPELHDRILAESAPTKTALPWLKQATFGTMRTDARCLRHDANVIGFDGIELDYDGEAISFEEAIKTVERLNVRTLIYTSPSHTVAAPRWRLLLTLSKSEARLEMREKLVARVNGFFGGIFGPESFKLSQSYYYGRANDNPDADHRAVVIDGRFIDLCDDLYKFELAGMPKSNAADAADTSTDADADNPFTRAGNRPQGDNKWRDLNTEALANLSKWVPTLFPKAKKSGSGYRVTSKALGRDLVEDLAITPKGIKDFGVHDIGDAREGKRTPIDLVVEHGGKDKFEAFEWLSVQLGRRDPNADDDEDKRPIVSDKDRALRLLRMR